MVTVRHFFILLIFLAIAQAGFSQHAEGEQGDNWLLVYGFRESPILHYSYDRYSKEDIARFKEKMEALKNAQMTDGWEGVYFPGGDDPVGFSQLRWDSKAGFLKFHIYTCLPELRSINYGSVRSDPDSLELIPDVFDDSPRTAAPQQFIKVKWGDRYYLVGESSLSAFAEKAVGIYLDPEFSDKWAGFWVKGDFEKPFAGLPVFPEAYKKFARLPIEARIIRLEKRTIEKGKSVGNTIYGSDTAFYRLIINAGRDKGVKEGMVFDIPGTNDEISITRVYQKSAVGIVARYINDDDKSEFYWEDGKKIPYPKLTNSLSVKTQIGRFSSL